MVFTIIPITGTEYKALGKVLSIDNFICTHSHYKKHYMVESRENLTALKQYREANITERHFNTAKK